MVSHFFFFNRKMDQFYYTDALMFTFLEFGVANIKISIFFNQECVFDFTHEENRIMNEIIGSLKRKIKLVNFSSHYKIYDPINKEKKNFGVKKKKKLIN